MLPGQQFGALSSLFLAVFVSTLGAASTAREHAVYAVFILVLIGMGVDGYAMFFIIGDSLPLWFRLLFISQIPIASIAGYKLLRRK